MAFPSAAPPEGWPKSELDRRQVASTDRDHRRNREAISARPPRGRSERSGDQDSSRFTLAFDTGMRLSRSASTKGRTRDMAREGDGAELATESPGPKRLRNSLNRTGSSSTPRLNL